VKELSAPATFTVAEHDSVVHAVFAHERDDPDHPIFQRLVDGSWSDVTCAEAAAQIRSAALGLIAEGVQPKDRVSIFSATRYEWAILDYAILSIGAVTVPIYETSSAEQVRWILSDSAAVAVVTETSTHEAMITGLQPDLPALAQVHSIDGGAVAGLEAAGSGVSDDQLAERHRALVGASIATIIYTSGTTGRPKGCELTHANFLGLTRSALADFSEFVNEDASTLLFLPLAHVFARYVQVLSMVAGSTLGHTPSVANLLEDLGSFKPTYLLAVPRVFEKIFNGAEARAQGSGRGAIFTRAADTAIAYSKAQDTGGPGLVLKLQHALFDRLVYTKLRAATGGRLHTSVSGGAPLGPRLGHFFRGIGLPVIEGWGLTETTAPATVNSLTKNKIGTVGRPLPGTTIRLADDEEILVKGVGVLAGYFNNPDGAQSLEDGWFATGDLGSIDDDGFVSIIGRKKEILITAGGKNVVPAVLEDHLRAHPLISQCIVVGDARPFIGCLITLDDEMLPTWLSNNGKPTLSVEQAATDPAILAELQKAVDAANAEVSKAESIRKFSVLTIDFTEASGHLTPKQSLKRAVVMKDFADQVEALYH